MNVNSTMQVLLEDFPVEKIQVLSNYDENTRTIDEEEPELLRNVYRISFDEQDSKYSPLSVQTYLAALQGNDETAYYEPVPCYETPLVRPPDD